MIDEIYGAPESDYNYEFVVAILHNDGKYFWHSNHETPEAYKIAKEVGGIVFHNIRITKKERKKNGK